MLDKNVVILEGIIGEDYKYGKNKDGKEFATFSLCVNAFSKEMADSDERSHSQAFLRVFVNDKRQIAYLRKVNAHQGNRAFIFGRLTTLRNEFKGNSYISTNVVCRDITIVMTNGKQNDA